MQTRRNGKAAKRFFEAVLGKTRVRPRVIVTDGLQSYNIIKRELLPNVEHRRSKYLNNRAENSHQPTRRRERRMQRFKSVGHAQLFCRFSIFSTTTSTSQNTEFKLMITAINLPCALKLGHSLQPKSPLQYSICVYFSFDLVYWFRVIF